jgi:nitrogen fixation protein FixH
MSANATLGTSGGNAGSTRPARTRRPGWWIPWIFVGFFAVTIAVNGTMVWFAMHSWTGLETEHHWQEGIAYNSAIRGARAQEARGWQVGIDVRQTDGLKARVAVDLKDRYGNNLTNAVVTAKLIRPTSDGHDLTIPLAYQGDGRYGAEFDVPLAGQWDVRVVADHVAGDYQQVKRVIFKG